ncbi:MAG: hypothetical protein KDL10_05440, partial [Kiritimatiellae bacterium]|nr:hypothetical protein [Kiritimatiellia bacterium]
MTLETFWQSMAIALLVLIPGGIGARGYRGPWLARFAAATVAGIAITTPMAILLARSGGLSIWTQVGAVLLLSWGGLRLNPPTNFRSTVREIGLFTLVLTLSLLVIRIAPLPGEWIAGGWDPGVLLNQAGWVARTGSLHPADPVFGELIRNPALSLFLKTQGTLTEAYPGLPFDPEAGRWVLYFYPATPVLGAWITQWGDAEWLLRLPVIIALLAWITVTGASAAISGKNQLGLVAGIALAALPLWLYHARTPNSEMLELSLLAGLVGWGLGGSPRTTRGPVLFALMLTLVLNRISAILFGGLFLLFLSADVRQRPPGFWPWMASGLLGGWMYYLFLSPESMAKLTHVLPRILSASAAMVVGSGVLLGANRLPRRWHKILPWMIFAMGIGAWLMLEKTGQAPWREWEMNLNALTGYLHPAIAVGTGLGLLVLVVMSPAARSPMLFLALSLLIVLHQKHVAELYPWALKRYLPFVAPLVACSLLSVPLLSRRMKLPPWISAIILAGWLGGSIVLQRHAIRDSVNNREFIGLADHLASLAAGVPPDAVVVADHFRWATPLAALHGLTVLNGEALWSRRDPELTEEVLRQLIATGRPIVWMTGTSDGLDVYPRTSTGKETALATPAPLTFQETIQHPRNRGFTTRTVTLYGALWATPP